MGEPDIQFESAGRHVTGGEDRGVSACIQPKAAHMGRQAVTERQPHRHRITDQLRGLRTKAGLSLLDFEVKTGIPTAVLGSYERGDRRVSLTKLDEIANFYGHKVALVPINQPDRFPATVGAVRAALVEAIVELDLMATIGNDHEGVIQ